MPFELVQAYGMESQGSSDSKGVMVGSWWGMRKGAWVLGLLQETDAVQSDVLLCGVGFPIP